jgi:asparagine synthase (glutamine-hydrolysing)
LDLFGRWDGGSEAAANQLSAYQVAQSLFPSRARRRLLAQSVNRSDEPATNVMGLPVEFVAFLSRELTENDRTAALSHLTWRLFLGERCLRDMDSMSMAVSLEMRAPFTDNLFVEHVWRFPGRLRCAGAPDKPWEWRLMKPLLGDALAPRKKHGFIFPFQSWLQAPAGRTLVGETLLEREAVAAAGLEPRAVADLWETFCRGAVRIPWSRIWALFVLVHWCRRWGVSA